MCKRDRYHFLVALLIPTLTAMVNPILDRSPLSVRQRAWSLVTLAAVLLPLAAVTVGQTPERGIFGRVTDSSTGQGIEAVTVRAMKRPDPGNRQPGSAGGAFGGVASSVVFEEAGEAETDAQGRFRFPDLEPGRYVINARKLGYTADPSQGGGADRVAVTLSAGNPVEIEFRMRGGASVYGQLIDADTGEPVVGIHVAAELVDYNLGRITSRYLSQYAATTDSEGMFAIGGVPPGEYAIAVEPFATAPERWIEDFTEEDLTVVETVYESRHFPGGPGLAEVLPVRVATGAPVNVGALRVSRVNHYRARISLPQPDCPEGATFRLHLSAVAESSWAPGIYNEIACGSVLIVRGLPTGAYMLSGRTLSEGPQLEVSPDAVYAAEPLLISDRNTSIELRPRKGFPLEGSVILADGAAGLDLAGFVLSLHFTGTQVMPLGMIEFRLDEEHSFSLPNIAPGAATVRMSRLPPGVYVREVRYNGIEQPDMSFDFTGQGKLEVIVDTGAALVNGLVTQRDTAVPGARVVFVNWPMNARDWLQSLNEVTAGSDGRLQIYLAPGEYRVFALTQAEYGRMGEPGMLERLAARGERLRVGRNSSVNTTLGVSDPSR